MTFISAEEKIVLERLLKEQTKKLENAEMIASTVPSLKKQVEALKSILAEQAPPPVEPPRTSDRPNPSEPERKSSDEG